MTTTTTTTKKAKPTAQGVKAKGKPVSKTTTEKQAAPVAKVAEKEKAAPKATEKAKPATGALYGVAAPLVKKIVAHINDRISKGSSFYKSAVAYHTKAATVFPRAKLAGHSLEEQAIIQVFKSEASNTLAAGSKDGQCVFDLFMLNR